jgi:zinc transport system substrate-binding protein
LKMMTAGKILAFAAAAALAVAAAACRARTPASGQSAVATIFPVYVTLKEVAGARVDVRLLVQPGMEAHSFEPRPQDAETAASSRVFAYAGDVMEPWARNFARGLGGGVNIFDMSAGTKLLKPPLSSSSGAAYDPHYWLDFDNAAVMAQNAQRALSAAFPADAAYFAANSAGVGKKLSALDAEYKKRLSSCKSRTLIYAGHFSFGYLAARYNLDYHALGDISPEAEPSAGKIAALVMAAKAAGAKTVFAEEMASPRFANLVAAETGASVVVLNPMHEISPADFAGGADYFSIMETNLDRIAQGLQCR